MKDRLAGKHYFLTHAQSGACVLHVSAPKKTFPRAVDRNREKRLCKAMFRDLKVGGGTWVVRVTKSTVGTPYTALLAEVAAFTKRLGY